MTSWSTEDLRPHERFDGWLELRVARYGGGSGELAREHRAGFEASYSQRMVADALVSQVRTSAYHFERTPAGIARVPLDYFVIVQQLGAGVVIGPRDDQQFVPSGGFSTNYGNTPYVLRSSDEQSGFHANIVAIPFARCQSLVARNARLGSRPLPVEVGPSALFASYFGAFVEQAPHLTGAAAEVAVETLLQLALVARGLGTEPVEPTRDALRAGQLEAARQFIARNLPRADLTPARAARAIGISVRQLHHLFEPTGTTFSHTLLAQRLDRARRLLAQWPDRPVIDIALACGIESQTTFYRAFRDAFGMTPGEYRDEMSRRAD
jgi:AraC-like DNA-binding protein